MKTFALTLFALVGCAAAATTTKKKEEKNNRQLLRGFFGGFSDENGFSSGGGGGGGFTTFTSSSGSGGGGFTSSSSGGFASSSGTGGGNAGFFAGSGFGNGFFGFGGGGGGLLSFRRRFFGGFGGRRRFRTGMVIVPSQNSFNETYDNLIEALNNITAIRIFGQVDHSASAAAFNLTLAPLRLVVFGNPILGSPIMQQDLMAGLDLPQKMLVWQTEDGQVLVGYNPPCYLSSRYPAILEAPTLDTVGMALANIASAASGVPVDGILARAMFSVFFLRFSNGVITRTSDADFNTTWDRLVAALEASPANIAIRVDHSLNSNGVLTPPLPPSRLVIFGNPLLGTPLMQRSATAGIDLPLKILVTEPEPGMVQVSTNSIRFLRKRHGLRGLDLTNIMNALNNFVMAAAVTPSST